MAGEGTSRPVPATATSPLAPVLDPREDARAAGLRYVSDDRPGITRRRSGKGFSYRGPDGVVIRDKAELSRIAAIVIPPAWTQVWICPNPQGHILATGRDARGRKQYRYHPDWRASRDASKFDRMLAFAGALPAIRARLAEDLALRGLPREKVLAAVVSLIDETLIRVGNEEYARQNGSYGATTLRDEHVHVVHGELRLSFRGKAGKEHEAAVDDPRLAKVIRRCQHLPGEHLFGYVDHEGATHAIDSGDVNDYLREIAGEEITVKDFRTWGGSVLCHRLLRDAGEPGDEREGRSMIVAAIKVVASRLGNTPAVCRASYVHPLVLAGYLAGDDEPEDEPDEGLHPDEQRLRAYLAART
jgi:DNA topoisomerase-1